MKKEFLKNENFQIVSISIVIIILILILTPLNLPFDLNLNLPEKNPSVKIMVINTESCGNERCFNISSFVQELQNSPEIEVTSIEEVYLRDKKAQNLIKKHDINGLPAMVLETRNFESENLESFSDDIFSINGEIIIFDKPVPYFDLDSNEIKGLIDFIEIQDPTCFECLTYSQIRDLFLSLEIKEGNYEFLDISSERGSKLISENNIGYAPALLVSKNVEGYWWVFPGLIDGLEDKGNYYLVTQKSYPYKELSSGEVKGVTEITYLIDESCSECYDPKSLREAFEGIGIYFGSEKEVLASSAEGKNLIQKYNIKKVPTILISEEINDYEGISDLLGTSGTIEDGVFVFRDSERLGLVTKNV